MNRHLIIIIALLLCSTLNSMAQEFYNHQIQSGHPISDTIQVSPTLPSTDVASQLAIGHANRLDTYLSPEKYRGTEYRFISEVVRDSRKHLDTKGAPRLTYTLTHEGELDFLHNRVNNANALSGSYDFSYSAMRRWQIDIPSIHGSPLILRAGCMTDLNLGFSYNTRNSANNPAQGYASLAIGANVMAQYGFTAYGKSFRVNYEARIPFVGVMFSPNYGQSYYEIFNEGNYDHNIVVTSLATFQLRQQLSLDYALTSKTALRIGYLGDIRQAKPNNLQQHHYYNALTLGVVIKSNK